MVEVLGAFLSGSVPSMLDSEPYGSGFKNYFAAYDVAAFTDLEEFKEHMDQTLRTLRTTPPAPGQERVIYPGLSEQEEEEERRANGIPAAQGSGAVVRRHLRRTRGDAAGASVGQPARATPSGRSTPPLAHL